VNPIVHIAMIDGATVSATRPPTTAAFSAMASTVGAGLFMRRLRDGERDAQIPSLVRGAVEVRIGRPAPIELSARVYARCEVFVRISTIVRAQWIVAVTERQECPAPATQKRKARGIVGDRSNIDARKPRPAGNLRWESARSLSSAAAPAANPAARSKRWSRWPVRLL